MYSLNKNIIHNGKSYVAGSEIKPGDAGFKDLLAAGHINQSAGSKSVEVDVAPLPEKIVESIVGKSEVEIVNKPKKKKR